MHLLTSITGLLTAASLAEAHTSFTTLFINDVDQGDGTCVRQPRNSATSTNPITDLTSSDMACGRDGLTPVAFTCPTAPNATLGFLWRANPDGAAPGVIDKSHKGPCAVYLKAMPSQASTSARGAGWFKIWEEGYDAAAGKWCTEKLIASGGRLSATLPPGLPGGAYLARAELLALHNAPQGEPQFYIGCAQIFVESAVRGAPLAPPADREAAIPGFVRAGESAVAFNVYTARGGAYRPPGPPVWTPSAVGREGGGPVPMQTEGVIPAGCLVKNANWCGLEVASYSGEAGCWRAADSCFAQEQACYAAAPPSGEANCRVWARKCQGIQSACERRQFRGPPEAGKRLVEVFGPAP